METSFVFQCHPTEVAWEEYAFGRLSEEKRARLEEHLLACEQCQARLEEVTDYLQLMKAGLVKTKMARLTLVRAGQVRKVMWATAFAVGCMSIWVAVHAVSSATPHAPAQIMLASFRGGDGLSFARGPARGPLDLNIDLHGDMADQPVAELRLEVVTAAGKRVWYSAPEVSSGMLTVHLPRGLKAGLYWVRLYAKNSEILGEYGLVLE